MLYSIAHEVLWTTGGQAPILWTTGGQAPVLWTTGGQAPPTHVFFLTVIPLPQGESKHKAENHSNKDGWCV